MLAGASGTASSTSGLGAYLGDAVQWVDENVLQSSPVLPRYREWASVEVYGARDVPIVLPPEELRFARMAHGLGYAPDPATLRADISITRGDLVDISLLLAPELGIVAKGMLAGVRAGRTGGVIAAERTGLDWGRISRRTGGDTAEHIRMNHGSLSLTKPAQGVFYGKPISVVEDAWSIANQSGMRPVTIGNRDFYIVPRANSGYAGGMGGQLENLDHVTIITEAGSSRVVTAHPGTPPMPRGYDWLLGK